MPAPSVPNQHSRRFVLCALIFVLCSLVSSVRIFWDARTPEAAKGSSIDVAQRSDQRFATLKPFLPARGVIGYIGESGAPARGDYYRAEYALAPLVVDDSLNHPMVLANFPDSPLPAPTNLQLVKDFGHGVALFANPLYQSSLGQNKDAN
jgi:hypothetical protein